MKLLTNKVIFLTGGASGIGESCSIAYHKAGATLFVFDKNAKLLADLAAN